MTYIGEKEIESIEDNKVIFKDGTEGIYTDGELSYLVTKEVKDLTQMRDIVTKVVLSEINKKLNVSNINKPEKMGRIILDIMDKYNVRKGDIDFIMGEFNRQFNEITRITIDSYNIALTTAVGKAFGTYQEGIHPTYFYDNIKMSNIKDLNKF